MSGLFIGLMSGTSLDGADAVLCDLTETRLQTIACASVDFSDALRERLEKLSQPGTDGLDLAGECSTALADLYATVVSKVLATASVSAADIRAIGCHGQTVRHRPERAFTIQLGDPARLAEQSGIDVVADFRRRDMAAGGQGAPLVPAFHDAVFRSPDAHRAIVNIGGISNVTSLRPGAPATGFDCGPGNVLMDAWCLSHRGARYDERGEWAARGTVVPRLLDSLLAERYFAEAPPKSTGRELFNEAWLARHGVEDHAAIDVQATLLELTATAIVLSIDRYCTGANELYLCGGGARNDTLLARIAQLAAPRAVGTTDDLGVPSGQVEPAAFAWLASKCVAREAIDLSTITGARHPCVLGAVYPA